VDKTMEFDPEFVQQLLNYLVTKPYSEVYSFVNSIQQSAMNTHLKMNAIVIESKPCTD